LMEMIVKVYEKVFYEKWTGKVSYYENWKVNYYFIMFFFVTGLLHKIINQNMHLFNV
jgi:hypothetical protein